VQRNGHRYIQVINKKGKKNMHPEHFIKEKSNLQTLKKKRLVFYILMFSIPTLQFLIFYIYVNFNSIAMAFQRYTLNLDELGHTVTFAKLDNFVVAWRMFSKSGDMIINSLKLYACNLLVVTPLALLFSYYIAKKYACSRLFRVILYMPTIISGTVMAILYKYIATDVYIYFVKNITGESQVLGLLDGETGTLYATILFYNIWVGFGANVMLYTGTMSGIDQSIIESAQLDGVNNVQELLHIYIPLIYPTFITFIVTGITGIFTNQMGLYNFFGGSGTKFDVFGYYLYRAANSSQLYPLAEGKGLSYPELSALGLIITCILVPITLIVRRLMEKFGPSVD
jgi:ABC-type sugar transport system permease subunit